MTAVQQVARNFHSRGWSPIPIKPRSKTPTRARWQELVVDGNNIDRVFGSPDLNIGVVLGPRSGGLADVDLDCLEAVRIAPMFLPSTGAIFGRASKPKSHYLYKVSGAPDRATEKFAGEGNANIIELRTGGGTKGAQTVFPGSTHESGEAIEWASDGEPASVAHAGLRAAVAKIAAAVILVCAFPNVGGGRHDGMMALGGCLARAGWDVEDIKHFAKVVAHEGGSEDPDARATDAVYTALGLGEGNTYGFPKLKEVFGDAPAKAFAKIVRVADDLPERAATDDFYAYLPDHKYLYVPTRQLWPAASIDSVMPSVQVGVDDEGDPKFIKASTWLDRNRKVEMMTWAPGEPMIIPDRLVNDGGWVDHPGVACFNVYRPPIIKHPDRHDARLWIDHVNKIYPDDADHLMKWLAHRVQKPGDKINHAVILGGAQGIGKDTLLEPIKHAVGPWNFAEVSPQQVLGRFTGFLKSILLRISEVRDLGDSDRYKFYEHMKSYTAAPPDVHRVDEKHMREVYVFNVNGVVYTTNHKDGFHLTADDRRHYVAWSTLCKEDFPEDYWTRLWRWLQHEGGFGHVAAFLAGQDISSFDAKAPPPKTPAFWEIAMSNSVPENSELADALDALGRDPDTREITRPDAVTIKMIADKVDEELRAANLPSAFSDFHQWLTDRKNGRLIPHRMRECGYDSVPNPRRPDGRWVVDGERKVIYARSSLTFRDKVAAARRLAGEEP